jgi:XTP/dITP diphosphohydrolase
MQALLPRGARPKAHFMTTQKLTSGNKIVVASHNEGKVREIRDLLRPFGLETVSAAELNLPEPEETETTFSGNAKLKALAAATVANLPALSDDSGLAVDALNGDPRAGRSFRALRKKPMDSAATLIWQCGMSMTA